MKPYTLTGLAWGAAMVAVSCALSHTASALLPESNQDPSASISAAGTHARPVRQKV